MGFRFRRTMKLLPGVRLNFSARGVSATVGPRGASVNFGPRGTYANLGIPGSGMSWRERLDGPKPRRRSREASEPAAAPDVRAPEAVHVAASSAAGAGTVGELSEGDVARLIPLWPWMTLLLGGLAVALATGGGAGLLLGAVAAVIGAAGALGVPAHRAELRARLHGAEM